MSDKDLEQASTAEQRGLECRHCGCRHFRIIYLHAPGMGREAHPPTGVSPLRQANDNVGAADQWLALAAAALREG